MFLFAYLQYEVNGCHSIDWIKVLRLLLNECSSFSNILLFFLLYEAPRMTVDLTVRKKKPQTLKSTADLPLSGKLWVVWWI